MKNIRQLNVTYGKRKVGTLALYDRQITAFQYDKDWLLNGFSINPFSLPLENRLFLPKIDPFEGLFGVFSDSLPDGWGRLLVDRFLLNNQINPRTIGNLERLAIVGSSGMGALCYEPEQILQGTLKHSMDLDLLAKACEDVLTTDYSDQLDDLFLLGGSSGGARPKILTTVNNEDWIIKFPSHYDSKDIGRQEFDYALCAKSCGIEMADVRLFPSKLGDGYFGTKRFDRIFVEDGVERKHMISVSALLETSHRIPNLDYTILLKLTAQLTKSHDEVLKMYRLMCFNVFAHNRDDHSKNFSFINFVQGNPNF